MTIGEWISDTLAKIGSKIKLPKNVLNNLKINLLNNINNNSPVIYDKRTQILNINLGKQSPESIKDILSSLPEIVDAGFPTLKLTSTQKAEDYLEKIGVSENQKLIGYYADKLPAGDLVILKASLYLKSVLSNGGETISIKNDIAKRFGARGRNISNLCSANYFNTVIRTVYESMSKAKDFKIEMFWKEYNFIVDIYPFAVFVNVGMGEKEIKKTTLEIRETEKDIGRKKDYLASVLRLIAQSGDKNSLEILLAHKSLSEFLDQLEYVKDLNASLEEVLGKVKAVKADLEKQNEGLNKKKKNLEDLKKELANKKAEISDQKINKQFILDKTKQ